jgi:hypothetical protein
VRLTTSETQAGTPIRSIAALRRFPRRNEETLNTMLQVNGKDERIRVWWIDRRPPKKGTDRP